MSNVDDELKATQLPEGMEPQFRLRLGAVLREEVRRDVRAHRPKSRRRVAWATGAVAVGIGANVLAVMLGGDGGTPLSPPVAHSEAITAEISCLSGGGLVELLYSPPSESSEVPLAHVYAALVQVEVDTSVLSDASGMRAACAASETTGEVGPQSFDDSSGALTESAKNLEEAGELAVEFQAGEPAAVGICTLDGGLVVLPHGARCEDLDLRDAVVGAAPTNGEAK